METTWNHAAGSRFWPSGMDSITPRYQPPARHRLQAGHQRLRGDAESRNAPGRLAANSGLTAPPRTTSLRRPYGKQPAHLTACGALSVPATHRRLRTEIHPATPAISAHANAFAGNRTWTIPRSLPNLCEFIPIPLRIECCSHEVSGLSIGFEKADGLVCKFRNSTTRRL